MGAGANTAAGSRRAAARGGRGADGENVASALCYLLIPAIVFLVIAPYNQNKTVRFNAFQSIFLFVATVAGSIALGIVFGILHLWFIAFSIHSLYNLACFVLWIYLLITTFQGKTTVLPLIGPLAQQQA